jgi:hypothetical protein
MKIAAESLASLSVTLFLAIRSIVKNYTSLTDLFESVASIIEII